MAKNVDKAIVSTVVSPKESETVANMGILLQESFGITLEPSVMNDLKKSAGFIKTYFEPTTCKEDPKKPTSDDQDGDQEEGAINLESHKLFSERIGAIEDQLISLKNDLILKEKGDISSDPIAVNKKKEGTCSKYKSHYVLSTGVVSEAQFFSVMATADFKSLPIDVSADVELIMATQFNFRFLLVPPRTNEGPVWNRVKEDWDIPWDPKTISPDIQRRCGGESCEPDILAGVAIGLFDVSSVFFLKGDVEVEKLTSSLKVSAALSSVKRKAIIVPVSFVHKGGFAEHKSIKIGPVVP